MSIELRRALEQADRALAGQRMTDAADRRIREALRRGGRGVVVPRWVAAGALFAAASIAIGFWIVADRGADRDGGAVARATWEIRDASTDFDGDLSAGGHLEVRRGSCRMTREDLGVSVEVTGAARIDPEPGGLRLRRGRIVAAVAPRAAGSDPVRFRVSGGEVVVLGTRFSLEEHGARGSVHLHEGRIRFVSTGGESRDLRPGDSLAWPLADAAAPESGGRESPAVAPAVDEHAVTAAGDPEPAPASRSAPLAGGARPERAGSSEQAGEPGEAVAADVGRIDVDAVLEEVVHLRSRGRYAEAARVLSRALAAETGARGREQLSYELGALLTYHLQDAARACAHWSRHRSRFGGGRFGREVAGAERELGCAGSGETEP